jgi:hypothetical protein
MSIKNHTIKLLGEINREHISKIQEYIINTLDLITVSISLVLFKKIYIFFFFFKFYNAKN